MISSAKLEASSPKYSCHYLRVDISGEGIHSKMIRAPASPFHRARTGSRGCEGEIHFNNEEGRSPYYLPTALL